MSQPSILVVDDDPVIGSELEQALGPNPPVMHVAYGATSALALLDQRSYSVLVLDLALAEGTGLDVLHQLRARNVEMPVIIVTRYLPEYMREVLALLPTVKLILTKPYDPSVLAEAVRAFTKLDPSA